MRSVGDRNQGYDMTGKKISNYVFHYSDIIGQGNFSKVYKARHQLTNETVAIKIIELNRLKSKKLEELLNSEIQILQTLDHPNVLKCHEIFTSEKHCYIVTELCNQGDLQTKLKKKTYLNESQVQGYVQDIFKGLLYLGDNNIIHRDLKVANIFINNGEAKIADFGFAKITKQKFKDANIGSPIYMSPEGIIDNIYGPKTDVWAFGILIYELLHGKTPFWHCKNQKQLKEIIQIPISRKQFNPSLSIDIKRVILKCLQIDESKRIGITQLKRLSYFKDQNVNYIKLSVKDNRQTQPSQFDNTKALSSNQASNKKIQIQIQRSNNKRKERKQQDDFLKIPKTLHRYQNHASYFKLPLKDQNKLNKYSGNSYASSTNLTVTSRRHTYYQQQSSRTNNSILSARIKFKQCVYILHYCRLIYKHLTMMKDSMLEDKKPFNIFENWISILLKALIWQINERRVIFTEEERHSRSQKLEEVVIQYITKYNKDLGIDILKTKQTQSSKAIYDKIQKYSLSLYQTLNSKIEKDGSNAKLLQLGHSIIVIFKNTKIIRKSYYERDYKYIEEFDKIEEFLNTNKGNLNLASYQRYRKKYLLDYQI